MLFKTLIIAASVLAVISPNNCEVLDPNEEECRNISSCSSCITKSFCTWCVTKSKCTKQSCGNDNIIYPKPPALMAGPQFCPRVVAPEKTLTIRSGTKHVIVVKITQIYLYMSFTPWKCKIMLENMEPKVVMAVLIGDSVYCESTKFEYETKQPYVSGSAVVLWDYSKEFDGSFPFKVCRCDLDPNCSACEN